MTVEGIIINIIHRDEEAARRFQRAKHFKTRAIQSYDDALAGDDMDYLRFARRLNEAYKRNMRKCMERVTYLTGVDEETAKAVMTDYAREVVTDALTDSFAA